MMNKKLLDIYTDYLISSNNAVTSTGLAEILNNQISHDQITRFLSNEKLDSERLWKLVKPVVRKIENEDEACLIFDDTIEEKPYTDENEIIGWHYSHSKGCVVKGMNIITGLFVSNEVSIPVAFEVVVKDVSFCELITGKEKRVSSIGKNELLRKIFLHTKKNCKFKYVLMDNWYSSKENLDLIHKNKKIFVAGIKSNRTVATSLENKKAGNFINIDTLEFKELTSMEVYLKGMDFPMMLTKEIFINEDESKGVLYLITNDLKNSAEVTSEIYKRRWKIEVYHKSIKVNASLARSPTKKMASQLNHIFSSIYGFFKLEKLKIKLNLNHFAIRQKIYLHANIEAMKELAKIKRCRQTA